MKQTPAVDPTPEHRAEIEHIKRSMRPEPVQHPTFTAALSAAQAEMLNPTKDRKANAGKYQYAYVDLATILDAVRGPLSRNGIALTQFPGYNVEKRFAFVETKLLWAAEALESTICIPCDGGAQEIGSAITYARRYAIQSMCGIFAEEDDDAQSVSKPPARPSSVANSPSIPKAAQTAHSNEAALGFYRVLNRGIAAGRIQGGSVVRESGKRSLIENMIGPLPEGDLADVMTDDRWNQAAAALMDHFAEEAPHAGTV